MSSSDSDKPPTCPAGTTNTAKATGEDAGGGGVSGSHSSLLHGTDIAQILQSQGPIVKAVLLRHMRKDGRDAKPHPPSPTSSTTNTTTSNSPTQQQQPHKKQRVVLTDMIDEIEIDTTPSKAQVKAVLGGPFTFLGQYPDQGTVLMIRKELPDYNNNSDDEEQQDLHQYSIKQLRELCNEFDVNVQGMIEKEELIEALQSKQELPINPHHLQPPFDGVVVRGDILILRVAETPEELDQDDDNDDDGEAKQVRVLTNEEFFLDYTKEEYIAFASRTDIVAPEMEENEQDAEEEEEEEEDAADEDYDPEEEAFEEYEEGSEEEKRAMLNVIMSEVLKKFRENNGRGPDTRELLELRSQVAQKLGVEVASFQAEEPSNRKRSAGDEDESHASKKVKFSGEESNSDDNRDQSNGDDKEEEEETS